MAKIEYRKGNLLDVKAGVIAHGVNCQGVMGSGVALAIRQKYPKVFEVYASECRMWKEHYGSSGVMLGQVQIVPVNNAEVFEEDVLVVANCFTQDFFGTDKRHVHYTATAICFQKLNRYCELYGRLNMPKIGAGLGGGNWQIIEALLDENFHGDVTVWEL